MDFILQLFTIENLSALFVIFILEMILGFDNLLYISIEASRAPIGDQRRVRQIGIIGAVILRIMLLALLVWLISYFNDPLFTINHSIEGVFNLNLPLNILEGTFTLYSIIFILGGIFLVHTAVKEISHMLVIDDLEHEGEDKAPRSASRILVSIFLMNIVFSFDSTLTAMAISKVFIVQALGIILSSVAMYLIADAFAAFLKRNRMYEVLGLFVLLIVGISLLGEGGHLGHVSLFGYPIEPLAKSTFYFSIAVLFIVEVVQTRYQRKLENERNSKH